MATQAEISYHYDVDNDFYAAFLDKDHMAYSCGVWDGALDLEHAAKTKVGPNCFICPGESFGPGHGCRVWMGWLDSLRIG
ncbi:class I SAM-dependent methyltransferase [Bradyrhizobium yuanmingense]|uniref:Uncharacterized protein n=1 Tax=Bradyrhizobium yuanmingense TaxID=108015 RepID=A0ABV4G7B5_9BRAD|nr:class I SAM-dependent methyltransferase [Bradyrhizobium yuanmingense]